MCGTLLFDDAEKCTKCGLVLVEKKDEGASENPVEAIEDQKPQEEPTTGQAPEPIKKTEDQIEPFEASEKRKRWLEEQEKIKSELASIMGRVGKKKKPAKSPQPATPPPSPAPAQASKSMVTAASPAPETTAPSPAVTPVTPMTTAAPSLEPTPQQPMSSPMGTSIAPSPGIVENQTPTTQPQQASVGIQVSNSTPKSPNFGPESTPVVPAQAPGETSEAAVDSEPQEGLSEINKNELLQELDDLRNEGYNVSKLEEIIEKNPADAWKAFSDFLDDIEKLNQQKERLEKINTSGYNDLETEKKEILLQMIDPGLLKEYETLVTQFENKFLSVKSEKQKKVEEEKVEQKKKEEQLNKLIESGKEAFRLKQYEKAMEIFTEAAQLQPDNREVIFFKKKTETKLMEAVEKPAPPEEKAEAPPLEVAGDKKKKKKKKKKIVARKSTIEGKAPDDSFAPKEVEAMPEVTPGEAAPTPAPGSRPGKPAQVPGVPSKPASTSQPVQPTQRAPQPAAAQTGPTSPANSALEGPRTAAEFEALGFNAYINKDYPKALEFYEKVLSIDPNFPNVQNIINECQMRLGKK